MQFPGFLGNEDLKTALSAAQAQGRLGHFYLLSGPAGSGKRTLARILSAAMLCTGPQAPCGVCPHCRKVFAGIHPDVLVVDDPERKTVPVDLVRRAREALFVRPNEGQRKILLIPRAQDLGLPGQNALLKVLEEPPAYGVFLLLVEDSQGLLPTVRSRCTELHLRPLAEEQLLPALAKDFPQAGREALAAAARRSGGYLGPARQLLEQPEDPRIAAMAQALAAGDPLALTRVLTPLEKAKREELIGLLEQWRGLMIQALAVRSGEAALTPAAALLGARRTSRQLYQAAGLLDEALVYAQGNVSPGAICGHLRWRLLQ